MKGSVAVDLTHLDPENPAGQEKQISPVWQSESAAQSSPICTNQNNCCLSHNQSSENIHRFFIFYFAYTLQAPLEQASATSMATRRRRRTINPEVFSIAIEGIFQGDEFDNKIRLK